MDAPPRRVLVIGKLGHGKSSLVNVVTGQVVPIGNGVDPRTTAVAPYFVLVDPAVLNAHAAADGDPLLDGPPIQFAMVDSPGMSEPTGLGLPVPAPELIRSFLEELRVVQDGIHLLVFVMTRQASGHDEERIHHEFVAPVAAQGVPVVLVFTGCEGLAQTGRLWVNEWRDRIIAHFPRVQSIESTCCIRADDPENPVDPAMVPFLIRAKELSARRVQRLIYRRSLAQPKPVDLAGLMERIWRWFVAFFPVVRQWIRDNPRVFEDIVRRVLPSALADIVIRIVALLP